MATQGSIARARDALRSPDFRKLLALRLCSQAGDGLFQAALVASVVFSPAAQSTASGLLKVTLIVALPFTIIGPFTGVFIDRWRRKRILMLAPILRALFAALVLADPHRAPFPFYAGAVIVLSVNRFHLATAQAVVPRLVPAEDLLVANSLATVGGTLALLVGVFAGGKIVDGYGGGAIVSGAILLWLATSFIASRIRSELTPAALGEDPELLRHQVKRVAVELVEGGRALLRRPNAIGPITTISVDQFAQGILLTLSLVVFKERFKEGVGSYSNIIAAGGVGVMIGIGTIGWLETRFARARIVAWSFLVGGIAVAVSALHVTGTAVLLLSFAVGLTFAWKKIPVDTMVQEATPDSFRGRVFSVYDVMYNGARILAVWLATILIPHLGVPGTLAVTAAILVAWTPVLPVWLRSSSR
jgi:MFS family permease